MPGPDPVAARRVLLHLDDGRRVPLDPAESERDWELRLEPPVNRVLPVARGRAEALWAAYGEREE
jgi:hypothetical protein